MLELGIVDYFGTGEGVTTYIISGKNKEEILNKINEYYHNGIYFYKIEELKAYISLPDNIKKDEKLNQVISFIQSHAPIFINCLKDDCNLSINYKIHFNYS